MIDVPTITLEGFWAGVDIEKMIGPSRLNKLFEEGLYVNGTVLELMEEEKMENKYQIGSQWRTRGGFRGVVVLNDRVYFDETDEAHEFNKDGTSGFDCMFDLLEPWVEKRSGNAYLHVMKSGLVRADDNKWNTCSVEDPVIAIKRIEWTEGQFDQ